MWSSTLVDELGYLSLGQQGSHLFFQVISARHQHKSTVIQMHDIVIGLFVNRYEFGLLL